MHPLWNFTSLVFGLLLLGLLLSTPAAGHARNVPTRIDPTSKRVPARCGFGFPGEIDSAFTRIDYRDATTFHGFLRTP